jgi:hypothetical protein
MTVDQAAEAYRAAQDRVARELQASGACSTEAKEAGVRAFVALFGAMLAAYLAEPEDTSAL